MALIFDDPSLDGRYLRDLMALYGASGPRLLDLRRQTMPAVPALLRQDRPNLVDSFRRNQRPMRPAMAGLPASLPPTLLSPAPPARLACQSIGGRRFGGIRGVLFASSQLSLQFRDLLLFLGDFLSLLGQLPAQLLHFAAQTFVLATQCLSHRR
jgi:hypothetical protein